MLSVTLVYRYNPIFPTTPRCSSPNDPRAFVICYRPTFSIPLRPSLSKIRGASGQDQRKVPYSQQSPVFSVRFLVVAAPFHSIYMNGTEEDLDGEEL
jgi:fatty acid synthase subunit beta